MENMRTSKMWYEKLLDLDRRIIYLLVAVVVAFPLLRPIGLPMVVSDTVTRLYDKVALLKPGDIVVFSYDYSASSSGDISPQVEAILKHIVGLGVKVVAVSFWEEGPVLAENTLKIYEDAGKTYGIDYINLGYCAGGENAIAKFAEHIAGAFPKDFRGEPTESYPIMKGLKSVTDFTMAVDFSGGSPGPREWIRQVQNQYGKEIACGVSSSLTATLMPYYDAGQIFALLSGLRGAAEYEALTGQLGKGSSGMGSQTLGHLLIIAFLILGNIAYFVSKSKRKGEGVTANE
jgi:hypothetical protein